MAEDQEITAAKERVNALRSQIREEQNSRAVATADSAKEMRLSALDAEEQSLLRQLETVRNAPMPGASPSAPVVPVQPEEGTVNVAGGPVRPDQPQVEAPEGAVMETVDNRGNLVRVPVNEAGGVSPDSQVALTDSSVSAPDESTLEDDPPLPPQSDGANLGRNKRPRA